MEQPMSFTTTSLMRDGKLVEGDLSLVDEDLREEDEEEGDDGYCSGQDDDSDDGHNHRAARKAQEAEERKSLLGRKEEKGVQCLRISTYLVVIITAVIVSVGVYFHTKKQEETSFEQVFETNANKLAQAFLDSVDRKIVAVGGLSTSITQYAITKNLTFPNVTIDNWETMGVQTRIQADGMVVEWCPLVTDEQRAGWEEYADTHKDWQPKAAAREEAYKHAQDAYFGREPIVIQRPSKGDDKDGPPPKGQGEGGSNEGVQGQGPPQEDQGSPHGRGQDQGPPPGGEGQDPPHGQAPQGGHGQNPPAGGQGQSPGQAPQGGQSQGPSPDGQNQESPPSNGQGPPPGEAPPERALQGQGPPEDDGRHLPDAPPRESNRTKPTYTREIFVPRFDGGAPKPEVRPLGSGPYAPIWQMSPVMTHSFLLNIDFLSMPAVEDALQAVLESKKAVLSKADAVVDPNNITKADKGLINIMRDYLQRGQYRHDQSFYKGDPTTGLSYPVFDAFGPNRTLAGFVQMPMLWRLNLEKVLPDGTKGVVAVLKNNFNQSFSYYVDGPKVTYLGLKDLHDSKYDGMFKFASVAYSIKANHGPESQTYDAVELDTDFGRYYLYVYPSQALEDDFVTNEPAIYAAIVASIFAFTLLVLSAFDFLVARRQKIVMKKAVESTALVSTLYPKQVRDRLFEDEPTEVSTKRRRWRAPSSSLTMSTSGSDRAIAERYPASSVLLMDLAGFTRWSASREPEAVFVLLENIYQSFDRIAAKRKVYKIETIGDCWVGVTGVPDFQADHAPRMAKFAAACQVKMGQLIANRLTDMLGPDTADLMLRVGIDSGPITGGILRGDRGRFQLFGDTINTASRMESNGVPGKIHVSQAFANEMINHGYESWLVERENKTHAKGKGWMTTFWVNVVNHRSTTTRSTTEAVTDSVDDDFLVVFKPSDSNGNASNRLDCKEQSHNRLGQLEQLHAITETGGSQSERSLLPITQIEV